MLLGGIWAVTFRR